MAKNALAKAIKHSKRWHEAIRKKVLSNPESRAQYERTRKEIELALTLRNAREKTKLSQEDVAKRMHTTRSAVSRLESCGSGRHSPSVETLLKYAQALGYTVKIGLSRNKHTKSATK